MLSFGRVSAVRKRRKVELRSDAQCGHENVVSRHWPKERVRGAGVPARGIGEVHREQAAGGEIFSESRMESRRDRTAEVYKPRGSGGCASDRAWRRGRRTGRGGTHGIVAGDFAVQSRAAAGAAEKRISDARFPDERTQEVRTERRAEALPVHQALGIWAD